MTADLQAEYAAAHSRAVRADGCCGHVQPIAKLGETVVCERAAGHDGDHQNHDGTWWVDPNRAETRRPGVGWPITPTERSET